MSARNLLARAAGEYLEKIGNPAVRSPELWGGHRE
jgi:hypothetical protein